MRDKEEDKKEEEEDVTTKAPISDAVLEAFDPLDGDETLEEESLEPEDDEGDLADMGVTFYEM